MSDFKCNKCETEIDIAEFELWELYSDEDHQFISCPSCDEQICIKIERTHSFECIDVEDL
jgi:DNA-directed RNA polymerase subunit RPC12/RpoP